MPIGLLLDVVAVVLVVVAIVSGVSRGFLRAAGAVLGLVVGGAAALIVMPIVSANVPLENLNVAVALAAGALLIIAAVAIGEGIARAIRRPVEKTKLRALDRLLGGVAGFVVSTATLLILAMSVGSLGIPGASQAVASSTTLRLLHQVTPAPVEAALARLRSIVIEDGIPTVLDAAGAVEAEVPDANADTAALRTASWSVSRITTHAPACGTGSSGSGFVIGDGLVMTNAHVVAGARDVVVDLPGQFPRPAQTVYFDPGADIAVLSADGLTAPALPFSTVPPDGATVFFQGYPYGGPFTSRSAAALTTGPVVTTDIYDRSAVSRSVTRIAGKVESGNSGGPLLTSEGAVAGMIFARSESTPNIGFALSMEEIAPVLAVAPGLRAPVPTGACS